eukprot:536241-Alexandrium_andersonii.AAC.1
MCHARAFLALLQAGALKIGGGDTWRMDAARVVLAFLHWEFSDAEWDALKSMLSRSEPVEVIDSSSSDQDRWPG